MSAATTTPRPPKNKFSFGKLNLSFEKADIPERPVFVSPVGKSRSLPTSGRYVQQCPVCRDESGSVQRFRYWTANNSWIYHCSAENASPDGFGSTFCGALFSEDCPRAACEDCGKRLNLYIDDMPGKTINFYFQCPSCQFPNARK